MIVRVHQTGRHVIFAEIDHLGALRNGDIRPDGFENAFFHQKDLVRRGGACLGIHQMPRSNGDCLRAGKYGRGEHSR